MYPRRELHFDTSKPDGTPRKVLDVSRIKALGWSPRIAFDDGVRATYDWFLAQDPSALRGVEPVAAH